jgi:adenine deaminase
MVLVYPKDPQGSFSQGIGIRKVWQSGIEWSPTVVDESSRKTAQAAFSGKNLQIKQSEITSNDFKVKSTKNGQTTVRVIGVRPGQIVTDDLSLQLKVRDGEILVTPESLINKISVIERHHGLGHISTGFVQGFSLKSGAIATSINHDCHNVIVTGSNEDLMADAVRRLRSIDGGIVVVGGDGEAQEIALPIGGLMTDLSPEVVAQKLRELKKLAKKIGCELEEPFLQLSFLALPVIPSLKITDRGLVDGAQFKIVPVEI